MNFKFLRCLKKLVNKHIILHRPLNIHSLIKSFEEIEIYKYLKFHS